MKLYMQKYVPKHLQPEELMITSENKKKTVQDSNNDSKTSRNKKHQAAKEGKLNLEHVREIERCSLRKQKAENPQHKRPINKQSVRKRQRATVLANVLQITCSCHELQPQENKYDTISIYDKFVSCSASRTALQNMCDDND